MASASCGRYTASRIKKASKPAENGQKSRSYQDSLLRHQDGINSGRASPVLLADVAAEF
jgi:hypothetical protein